MAAQWGLQHQTECVAGQTDPTTAAALSKESNGAPMATGLCGDCDMTDALAE